MQMVTAAFLEQCLVVAETDLVHVADYQGSLHRVDRIRHLEVAWGAARQTVDQEQNHAATVESERSFREGLSWP